MKGNWAIRALVLGRFYTDSIQSGCTEEAAVAITTSMKSAFSFCFVLHNLISVVCIYSGLVRL